MSDEQRLTKAEVLHNMDDGWQSFEAYLRTLSDEQMTVPKDAVGWTVKDHLTHLT
ncbi:MAG: maleylpyruvate isomerase N-terminal domain-containing protein, partial [Anaerolineae bacterium]|nr:maleylpyruvate isomerase N-terminal domain-containing protein [Anaerolineae bacterium]